MTSMSSQFGLFPDELFLQIIDAAVSMFLIKDRTTVVRLCQTSKAVYNHIAPTLYHTIIITGENAEDIEEFAIDADTALLAARIFSHTRTLHEIARVGNFPTDFLQNVESIHASFHLIRDIAVVADRVDANAGIPLSSPSSCSIRRIHMRHARLRSVSQIPVRTRANFTHFCGQVSTSTAKRHHAAFVNDPEAYMRGILDALPALIHLGLEISYVNILSSHVVNNWEIGAFERALRTALSYRRLTVIAIRVSGRFIQRWDEIICVLRHVSGSTRRLLVWKDDSRVTSWNEEEFRARDAAEGRSIWTEARPVQDI